LAGGPATFKNLPNCGHVPYREKTEMVLDRVRAFLEALV
jgi:hypothetical protein